MKRTAAIAAASLALAGMSGFLTAQALSQDGPVKTETITIRNGDPGPPGPAGPKGDPGETTCPAGFVRGKLIINHPGGQTTIFTCLEG